VANPLRVAVIATRLSGTQTGVARYLRGVLDAWGVEPPSAFASVTLFSPRVIDFHETEFIRIHRRRSRLTPLLWESAVLPRLARLYDVLWAPSFTMPLMGPLLGAGRPRRPPCLLGIYDAHQLLRPRDFGWRGRLLSGPAMRRSAARAQQLVTISEEARRDLSGALDLPPSRIEIVPGGVDLGLYRSMPTPASAGRRGNEPFVLFVGKLSRRRNIDGLIEAAAAWQRMGLAHELLLVGANSGNWPISQLASQSGARVRHLDDVDDRELRELYRQASVFVQAPLHETFSLPMLEAMASATPVVTSDRHAMREEGGDAATYVDPRDPADIARAVADLVSDPDRRRWATEAGLLRAKEFSWQGIGRRYAQLLAETASNDGGFPPARQRASRP
jgi:glycosyltransferase involved in cell wall biosynthesis